MKMEKKDPLYRSGGGYGDRRIPPVGESCERYRSRSSAHCGNYGSNRRVHYIFAEDSADIAVIQFRTRLP